MATKTERMTILVTSDFKDYLTSEAEAANVSVAELVRRRCQQPAANEDQEAVYAALLETVQQAGAAAKASLNQGIADAEAVLRELRCNAVQSHAGDAESEG